MSDQQFRDTLFTLADNFGFALVVEIFQEVTHADLEVYLNTTKWPTSCSDRERMALELDKFYKK